GQKLGPSERYTIERKLGWGMHSSIWLARDTVATKFVAVKVLTGYWTGMCRKGIGREPEVLRVLEEDGTHTLHCVRLLETFELPGTSVAEGDHICLVSPVYRGDFGAFSYPYVGAGQYLPLPVIKRVLLHTLRGIVYAHVNDIKRDNIFIDTGLTNEEIEDFLVQNPPRRHDPEMSEEGIVQSAVSQTFPPISMEEAAKATYLLADFSSAQTSVLHPNHEIVVIAFRPPEVFLNAPWGKPADIWAFGCLVFEMLTGRPLFIYKRNEVLQLSEVPSMIFQMATVTREMFQPEYLKDRPEASELFGPDGKYKDSLTFLNRSVAYCSQCSQRFDGQEELIAPAAALIHRALRIDPEKRVSAEELLEDPWFDDVV
ncbi:kinase-like domain-containing protein, partial [Mucidula mucida]